MNRSRFQGSRVLASHYKSYSLIVANHISIRTDHSEELNIIYCERGVNVFDSDEPSWQNGILAVQGFRTGPTGV